MRDLDLSLDYHSHILPGCDHGSDSTETSCRQIEMAKEAGVTCICATPHFYPHQEAAGVFLKRREACWEALRPLLRKDDPRIRLGAEVLICDNLDRMDALRSLCLQDSDELLLEMPFYRWPESVWDTAFRLNDLPDIQIVIAHADRYPAENIEELIHAGIPLQLNASCLMHPLRRARYLAWIREGAVRYLGSDIHMLGKDYQYWKKCRKLIG